MFGCGTGKLIVGQKFIGKVFETDFTLEDLKQLGDKVEVVPYGNMVIQNYRMDRIRVYLDEGKKVTSVKFG